MLLCRTCAEQQLQEAVSTAMKKDTSRGLDSVELSHAVAKGYSVVKIIEVWHFPQTSDDLFSGYVKTFLKFKQEASGFPPQVASDSEKEAYADAYFEKEGIQLDLDKIAFNPPRRSIMKFLLNSLWGRFALRCNLPTTEL